MIHPQGTTPANPAQVTDAMVEAASAKYREIGARCNWQHSWPSEEAFHEIITAAIGAGGQAVAWQYRMRTRRTEADPWCDWSDWRDGKANVSFLLGKYAEYEERPLYTHPAPTPPSPGVSEAMVAGWKAADAIATLRARLEAVEALLKRVQPALNDAFAGGMEEREGGSAKRQARHLQSVDALRNDIRATLREPQT